MGVKSIGQFQLLPAFSPFHTQQLCTYTRVTCNFSELAGMLLKFDYIICGLFSFTWRFWLCEQKEKKKERIFGIFY
jgi:hypothetical protein